MDVEACYYDGIQDVEDYLARINIRLICVNLLEGLDISNYNLFTD